MVKFEKRKFKEIKYLLYYPKDFDPSKKYPLFFHLHGAGSRGNDFEEFKGSTILNQLSNENTPLSNAICIFPQCNNDTWFDNFNELLDLVEMSAKLQYVDKEKIVGSGISMGGFAMYQVLMSKPNIFKKAIICCGGGMYWNSGRISHIKFKIFHGEKDTVVYPEEAKRMYEKLKENNADVSLVLYPECDHNCWDKTFKNIANLEWIVE